MVNTKCFFGIHQWEELPNHGKPRRKCSRCGKRQVFIKFSRYSGKWLRN